MRSRLFLLDRDGVVNEDSPQYIKTLDEWIPIPGSIDAIARLSRHGYSVCIVSNQSGLARGLLRMADLEAIHRRLVDLVATAGGTLRAILFCPHGPHDQCPCRKPRPGLLLSAAEMCRCDLEGAPMVGDSVTDVLAARKVGAQPILVRTGKGRETLERYPELTARVPVFDDLGQAVDEFLRHE